MAFFSSVVQTADCLSVSSSFLLFYLCSCLKSSEGKPLNLLSLTDLICPWVAVRMLLRGLSAASFSPSAPWKVVLVSCCCVASHHILGSTVLEFSSSEVLQSGYWRCYTLPEGAEWEGRESIFLPFLASRGCLHFLGDRLPFLRGCLHFLACGSFIFKTSNGGLGPSLSVHSNFLFSFSSTFEYPVVTLGPPG